MLAVARGAGTTAPRAINPSAHPSPQGWGVPNYKRRRAAQSLGSVRGRKACWVRPRRFAGAGGVPGPSGATGRGRKASPVRRCRACRRWRRAEDGAPLRPWRRSPFCVTWPQSGLEFLTRVPAVGRPRRSAWRPEGVLVAAAPLMRALAGGPGKGTATPRALVRLHPARSPHSAPATREAAVPSCGRAPNDQRSRPASRAAARAGARSCGAGHAKSGGHDAGRSCHAPRSTLRSSTRSGRNCCRQQPPGGYAGRSGPAAARTVPAALPRPACRRAGV